MLGLPVASPRFFFTVPLSSRHRFYSFYAHKSFFIVLLWLHFYLTVRGRDLTCRNTPGLSMLCSFSHNSVIIFSMSMPNLQKNENF